MGSRGRIVLFGDSITQQSFSCGGWGARMADAYQRKADVLNRGYSGYNTRSLLFQRPDVLAAVAYNSRNLHASGRTSIHLETLPPFPNYKRDSRSLFCPCASPRRTGCNIAITSLLQLRTQVSPTPSSFPQRPPYGGSNSYAAFP